MVFDPVHPYSHGLMSSILVPEEGTRGHKLTAIPGTPPNLKNRLRAAVLPSGASTPGLSAATAPSPKRISATDVCTAACWVRMN